MLRIFRLSIILIVLGATNPTITHTQSGNRPLQPRLEKDKSNSLAGTEDKRKSEKVILINVRGTSKSLIDELIRSNALDENSAFKFLNNNANPAIPLDPVPNAVTAVNNATLETGTYPNENGIIGNSFGKPGEAAVETASGFDTPFLSETIWEKTGQSGKKVIRLGTLQVNGRGKNDFKIPTLPQVSPLFESQLVDLSARAECDYRISAAEVEYFRCLSDTVASSSLKLSFGQFHKELVLVAIDSVQDGKPIFQSLIVDEDFDEKNGYLAKIVEGEWFSLFIERARPASIGNYSKLVNLSPDLTDIRLYVGPVFQNNGYPDSFVSTVEDHIGFAAGGPDYPGFVHGRIDIEALIEQAHRETDYMQRVALYCLKHIDFDLLIYDHPILDRYGHYLYSKKNRKENLRAMTAGYVATDENLKSILDNIDKTNTSLLVVSGHGFSTAHTSISINKLFESLHIKVSSAHNADLSVFSSKVSAHIYLNKRHKNEDENNKYLLRLKKLLQSVKDRAGRGIVDKVLLRSEMRQVYLNNKLYGSDVWICLKPGYTFDGLIQPDKLIGKPFFAGEHGYFDGSNEAKGAFYYFGRKKVKIKNGPNDSTMIGPIISLLLNIPERDHSAGLKN